MMETFSDPAEVEKKDSNGKNQKPKKLSRSEKAILGATLGIPGYSPQLQPKFSERFLFLFFKIGVVPARQNETVEF